MKQSELKELAKKLSETYGIRLSKSTEFQMLGHMDKKIVREEAYSMLINKSII